jgi:hypothetical protein
MLFGAGAAYQCVEPLDLSIKFVADATLQDQSRIAVVIGILCLEGAASDIGTRHCQGEVMSDITQLP